MPEPQEIKRILLRWLSGLGPVGPSPKQVPKVDFRETVGVKAKLGMSCVECAELRRYRLARTANPHECRKGQHADGRHNQTRAQRELGNSCGADRRGDLTISCNVQENRLAAPQSY